jgi:hypothetical protein
MCDSLFEEVPFQQFLAVELRSEITRDKHLLECAGD